MTNYYFSTKEPIVPKWYFENVHVIFKFAWKDFKIKHLKKMSTINETYMHILLSGLKCII